MLLSLLCLSSCLTPPEATTSGLSGTEGRTDTAAPEDQDDPGAADVGDDMTLAEDSGSAEPVLTGDCSGGGSAGFCTGRGEARGASDGVFPTLFKADFDGFTELCGVESDSDWLTCHLSWSDDCAEPVGALPMPLDGALYVCGEATMPEGPTEGICTIETGAGPLEFRVILD